MHASARFAAKLLSSSPSGCARCPLLQTQHRHQNTSASAVELRLTSYGSSVETSLALVDSSPASLHAPLKANEVRVRLLAAPINPADLNIIQGKYAALPDTLPAILGNEGAFEVLEVASGVDSQQLRPGDWVLPSKPGWGTWRSHAVERADAFIKLPTNGGAAAATGNTLSKHACATLLVNPPTAWRLLHDFCAENNNNDNNKKISGDTVVIQNGANSGVGLAVIQLCRELGVPLVSVVRRRPDAAHHVALVEQLRAIGAQHVLAEDELRNASLTDELWKRLDGRRPTLALNCVSGRATTDMVRLLGNNATLVTYGGMSRQPLTLNTADFIFKDLRCRGFWLTSWRREHRVQFEQTIGQLCGLISANKLRAPPCEEFPLSEYRRAFERARTPYLNAKVLLVPD